MQINTLLKLNNDSRPTCVGTGFLALDIVVNGNPEAPWKVLAGGSCGNVLTILSYLGWSTHPVARLGQDEPAAKLLNDLISWRVKTDLVFRDPLSKTPIVIEKLTKQANGKLQYQFKWHCPTCGTRLPRYRPITPEHVRHVSDEMPGALVFYFDRVSRSSVELANFYKARGALIFFEPSSMRRERLFSECLRIADIVKYSRERLNQVESLTRSLDIPLEVETLSVNGLRYRLGKRYGPKREWKMATSYPVGSMVDAVGSGDWCSAGIIHLLGRKGRRSFEVAEQTDVETSLKLGQALAALNCYYEGARGSMYNLTKLKFELLVNSIYHHKSPKVPVQDLEGAEMQQVSDFVCPSCAK